PACRSCRRRIVERLHRGEIPLARVVFCARPDGDSIRLAAVGVPWNFVGKDYDRQGKRENKPAHFLWLVPESEPARGDDLCRDWNVWAVSRLHMAAYISLRQIRAWNGASWFRGQRVSANRHCIRPLV